tara:strand:+ start:596 stop:847 length:252 start_codon:yes stop_codon:yes gene_type:complete
MKLLYTISVMLIIASGCATTLKSTPVTSSVEQPSTANATAPTTYEYIVLADGTLLVAPVRTGVKRSELSNPVISNVRISAEYR